MIVLRIWICLSALLFGLPLQADSIVFGRRPGITCGVRGGEAHMVWDYDDTFDTVNLLRWYNGTEATGISMGTYYTEPGIFTPLGSYVGKINFASPMYTAGFKGAKLTFRGLEAFDAGIYSAKFQTDTDTIDLFALEVAERDDLHQWEICIEGICKAISDTMILPASADVKIKFTKGGALTCDMDIDVAPSVGVSFILVVPAGEGATAEHPLADPATLLAAGSLSIDLAFGKNGAVFDIDTIATVSVISDTAEPSGGPPGSLDTPGGPWNNLYVLPIVLGVCTLVILIVVIFVVVCRRRNKMETRRPDPQDRNFPSGGGGGGSMPDPEVPA